MECPKIKPISQIILEPKFWVIWVITLAIVLAVTIPRKQEEGHLTTSEECLLKKQILGINIAETHEFNFDGWGFTHVLLYFILGYMYPGHFWFFFFIGLAWEIFEEIAAPRFGKLIYKCDCEESHFYCENVFQSMNIHAEWEDVFSNSIGYLLGQYLALNCNKKQ